MGMPYRARVNERTLLNLPGFHGGAFVYVYVEDTSERDLGDAAHNFEPQMIVEIADCDRRIALQFDIDSAEGRENSVHKLDTLVSALRVFRQALAEEFEPYDRRAREMEEQRT